MQKTVGRYSIAEVAGSLNESTRFIRSPDHFSPRCCDASIGRRQARCSGIHNGYIGYYDFYPQLASKTEPFRVD